MIGQNVVQELAVDDEDVVQVVQVIQVFGYQVAQLPSVLMPGEDKTENGHTVASVLFFFLFFFNLSKI